MAGDVTELIYLLPPEVDPVCGAAVDPLEIAAALEAAGVSNQVARTTFGQPDLFTLAEELYNAGRGAAGTGARPRPGTPAAAGSRTWPSDSSSWCRW